MSTKIWIDEEYGYRSWYWVHPGTAEDVIADWKEGKIPVSFWGLRDSSSYVGTCEEMYTDREFVEEDEHLWRTRDGLAHVHMDNDTSLEINGQRYGWPFQESIEPTEEDK